MSLARFLRLALIIPAVSATLLAAGCASARHAPPGQRERVLVEHDAANGTTVRVQAGGRIVVILASSYWTILGSSAPAVVRQNGPATLLPPPPGGCIPGGGCRPVRASFTALTAGRAIITAHRITCGEALLCGPSHRWYRLTVIVG